jgi:hypothetical protein
MVNQNSLRSNAGKIKEMRQEHANLRKELSALVILAIPVVLSVWAGWLRAV